MVGSASAALNHEGRGSDNDNDGYRDEHRRHGQMFSSATCRDRHDHSCAGSRNDQHRPWEAAEQPVIWVSR